VSLGLRLVQVRTRAGEWIAVPHIDNALLINIGVSQRHYEYRVMLVAVRGVQSADTPAQGLKAGHELTQLVLLYLRIYFSDGPTTCMSPTSTA
jgi:hypothetical protein